MLKRLVKKFVYGAKADSNTYVEHLKKLGVRIGSRTVFFVPIKTEIDLTRPWLLEIGNDVQITEGVSILTHGYDWSVLKGKYGDVLGSSGKVKIGNNVFIGTKTTILKGVEIGNNVIIGANSLVNHDIPNDVVVAGNPARIIMGIEEYYEKRKKSQYTEAVELVREYRIVYGKDPNEDVLSEFFWLFNNYEYDKMPNSWKNQMNNIGNRERSIEKLEESEMPFNSFEEFLKSIE